MFAVRESIFHFKVFRVLEDSHPRQIFFARRKDIFFVSFLSCVIRNFNFFIWLKFSSSQLKFGNLYSVEQGEIFKYPFTSVST